MTDVAALQVRVGSEIGGAMRGLSAVDAKLHGTASAGASMGKMLKAGALIAGAGMIYAAKSALNFGEQMRLIQTQAGGSAKDVTKLSKSVLDLAKHSAQGPDKLAKSLFHLKSVGMTNVQAMHALKTASDGATTGMADMEQLTNVLAGTWKTNIKGAGDFKTTMAVLNGIVGSGNLRMEDLTSALSTGVLPMVANAGLSIKDFGAALATATAQGIPAEQFATRFKTSLAMLVHPSKAAEAALNSVGISSSTLASDFQKPNGLQVALHALKDHFDRIKDPAERFKAELAAFGGSRGSAGIMTLLRAVDTLDQSYHRINHSQETYNASVAAAKAEPINKLKTAWSGIQSQLITLGTKALPVIGKIGDFAAHTAQQIGKVGHALKPVISAFGGWETLLKGAAVAFSAGKILSIVGIAKWGAAGRAAGGAFGGGLGGSLARSAGISGRLAGGLFSTAFGTALTLGITAAWMAVDWSRMAHQALVASRQVMDTPSGKPRTFGGDKEMSRVATGMLNAGASIKATMLSLDAAYGKWGVTHERVVGIVIASSKKVGNEVPAAIAGATSKVAAASRGLSQAAVAGTVGLKQIPKSADTIAGQVGPAIAKHAGGARAGGHQLGAGAAAGAKSGAATIGPAMNAAGAAGAAAFAKHAPAARSAGHSLGAAGATGTKSGLQKMPSDVASSVTKGAAGMGKGAGPFRAGGQRTGKAGVEGTKSGLAPLGSAVSAAVAKGASAARSKIGEYSSAGSALGGALAAGISGALSGLAGQLSAQVVDAINAAKSAAQSHAGIHSPSRLYADKIGKPLGQGIVSGFEGGASGLGDAVSSVVSAAGHRGASAATAGGRGIGHAINSAIANVVSESPTPWLTRSVNKMLKEIDSQIRTQAAIKLKFAGSSIGIAIGQGIQSVLDSMMTQMMNMWEAKWLAWRGRIGSLFAPHQAGQTLAGLRGESTTQLGDDKGTKAQEIRDDQRRVEDLQNDITDTKGDLADAQAQLAKDTAAGDQGAIDADNRRIRDDNIRLRRDQEDLADAQDALAKAKKELDDINAEIARRSAAPGTAPPGHGGLAPVPTPGHGVFPAANTAPAQVTINFAAGSIHVEGNIETEDQFAKSLAPKIRSELLKIGGRNLSLGLA